MTFSQGAPTLCLTVCFPYDWSPSSCAWIVSVWVHGLAKNMKENAAEAYDHPDDVDERHLIAITEDGQNEDHDLLKKRRFYSRNVFI